MNNIDYCNKKCKHFGILQSGHGYCRKYYSSLISADVYKKNNVNRYFYSCNECLEDKIKNIIPENILDLMVSYGFEYEQRTIDIYNMVNDEIGKEYFAIVDYGNLESFGDCMSSSDFVFGNSNLDNKHATEMRNILCECIDNKKLGKMICEKYPKYFKLLKNGDVVEYLKIKDG